MWMVRDCGLTRRRANRNTRRVLTVAGCGATLAFADARAGPAFFIQMPIVEELRRRFGVGTL